jgi:hypothetical protein
MAYKKILLRRDTASNWTSANPTLSGGEMGIETDTLKFKLGNGSTAWNSLDYYVSQTLNDIGDVTITSAADGDFLRWNGTAWINDAVNLSTDTIGSYVESLVAGTGVTLTNNSGEGATPTVAVDTSVIQARVTNVTDTEIGYLDGVTSGIQTQIDAKAPLASPTFTGTVTVPAPTNSTDAATKAYADAIGAGINWHNSVETATAAALPNTPTYENGTNGVGATLTASANARLVMDGINSTTGDRVLVKNQADATQNGIYVVTAQGSVSVPYVLTRASDHDNLNDEVVRGDAVYVANGSTNINQGFIISSKGTGTNDKHVLGTDDMNWSQFTGAANITAGTGITKTGNTLSIGQSVATDASVTFSTVTAALTGNASTATTLATARNIAGQSFNGSANISIAPTDLTGVTATAAELNILDGVTSTTAELNILDGVTATAAELNILDGVTATTAELNYVDGVTSDIQTQIDSKAPIASPTFTGTVTIPTGASITAPTGLVKGDVGLGSVDNTADTAKPVSTAQQTALDLKANLASPTFTGTVTVPTPTNGTDAATKTYADGVVTAANIITAAGGDGTNGQALTTNGAGTLDFTTIVGTTEASIISAVGADGAAGSVLKTNGSGDLSFGDVALGTNTSGSYVESLVAGTGVTLTNNSGEGATPTVAIGQAVATNSNVTFNDLTVSGNLTVSGTTTSINTETLTIDDNIIVLNNNVTATPTENAGIEIERGTSANVALRWNETSDKWEITADGSTYADIATETYAASLTPATLDAIGDVTITSATSGQFLKWNGSAWVNDSIPTINTLDDVGDVTITSATSGDFLKWNGTAWVNDPIDLGTDTTGSYVKSLSISASTGLDVSSTDDNGDKTFTLSLADVSTNDQNASYTLVLDDKNKIVEMNVASGNNLTVPPNSSVAFPVGTQINILQVGAGQTTVVQGAGVTVNAAPGLKLRTQWSYATLIKRAENTWVLVGDISA